MRFVQRFEELRRDTERLLTHGADVLAAMARRCKEEQDALTATVSRCDLVQRSEVLQVLADEE